MKPAAGLGFLLALGIWVGHALAALPGPTLLPTTSLPLTTALPTLSTTTVPLPTTTTVPKLPTTTTLPKLPTTTTVPKLPTTTTVPKLPTTTTTPKLPTTTTIPTSPVTTTATTTAKPATTSGTSTSPVASTLNPTRSLGPSVGSLGAAGAGSPRSSASSTSNAGPSGAPASNPNPQVQQLEPSRPFISTNGPKTKRSITLTFVLSHRGRVVFAVRQVSPVCRTIGYFSVRGRKGPNRIRFAGRVGRKRLGPGTYTILARTLRGQLVQRVTLVVVNAAKPSRKQLRAALAANACSETDFFSAFGGRASSSNFVSRGRVGRSLVAPPATGPATVTEAEAPEAGGVLGTTAQKAADAVRPYLVGLLVAAILALGLASLPRVAVPDNRLSEMLVRHRLEITTVGAAALVAVAIAFLIG